MVNPIRSALHCILPQAHEPEVAAQEQLGPCGRPIGGYREIGMALEGGWGKDVLACKDGVVPDYLSSRRLGQFELTVGKDDHRLYRRIQGELARINTTHNDKFLYAMDKDGHIYGAPASEVEHHSAFFAGHPGAAFGLLSVNDGVIAHLDNESGHYSPPADYGYQMLHELKARGVKVPKDKVVFKGSRAQLRKLGQAPKVRLCPDASHLKTMKH